MMKKSRFLSLALTGALCLSLLAGCGSSGGGGAASTPAPNGGGDVSTPAPAPAGDAFKIGGVGPLTGGAAIYGNAAANGARIAADEINALGGIQIDLRYEDDAHDAEKSVNAYNTLKLSLIHI